MDRELHKLLEGVAPELKTEALKEAANDREADRQRRIREIWGSFGKQITGKDDKRLPDILHIAQGLGIQAHVFGEMNSLPVTAVTHAMFMEFMLLGCQQMTQEEMAVFFYDAVRVVFPLCREIVREQKAGD